MNIATYIQQHIQIIVIGFLVTVLIVLNLLFASGVSLVSPRVETAQACTPACYGSGACTAINSCGETVAGTYSCGGTCWPNVTVTASDAQYYRVNVGSVVRAYESGRCVAIYNDGAPGAAIFVPGNSWTEFSTFVTRAPSGTRRYYNGSI